MTPVWIALASASGLACDPQDEAPSSEPNNIIHAEYKGSIAYAIADVMGFEAQGAWSTSTAGAVLGQSTIHSQGSLSLSVRPSNNNGYTPIKSVALSTLPAVSPTLAVDVMLPTRQPNPYWYGTFQVYLNCPSRGIYSQFLAQVELTGKPLAVWNTLTFPLNNTLVAGLLQAGYTDLTITVVLNVQVPTTGIYYIDNLRFIPVPPTQCGGRPNGTSCTDNNACTQGDTCRAGSCVAGPAVVCPGADQCNNAGTCNPGTGACSPPVPKGNGTPCSDENACTQTDTCQAGLCVGGNPVACTPSDVCHDAGICNTSTGVCSNPAKTGEAACIDDLIPLSVGNTCSSVTPMGTPFESAHDATPDEVAYLGDPAAKPTLPGSGLSWATFSVNVFPGGAALPSDVNQGLSDCDGVATMAEIAYLAPDFIASLITSSGDTYGVKMFDPKGNRITVALDSQFPADGGGGLVAAKGKNGAANWATLLEQAVMKYIHVWSEVAGSINGIAKEVVSPMLTGNGCTFAFNKNVLAAADLQRALEVSLRHGKLVVGGFGLLADGSNLMFGTVVLPNPHAWSGFWPADDSVMISFRNPWGRNDVICPPSNPSCTDPTVDGVVNVPLAGLDGIHYEQYIDIRIMEPGAAGSAGRTTPYVYP